jgi:hypothetical protein
VMAHGTLMPLSPTRIWLLSWINLGARGGERFCIFPTLPTLIFFLRQ